MRRLLRRLFAALDLARRSTVYASLEQVERRPATDASPQARDTKGIEGRRDIREGRDW